MKRFGTRVIDAPQSKFRDFGGFDGRRITKAKQLNQPD